MDEWNSQLCRRRSEPGRSVAVDYQRALKFKFSLVDRREGGCIDNRAWHSGSDDALYLVQLFKIQVGTPKGDQRHFALCGKLYQRAG
jgi:hypothetical protein